MILAVGKIRLALVAHRHRDVQAPVRQTRYVRRTLLGVALAALLLVAGGCGSTSSRSTSATQAPATLTKAQYLAMLNRGNARVTKVEGAAEQGLTPKATRAHVKALINAWADTETQLGESFRTARAPAKVAAANALLGRGEIVFGAELRYAASHLPRKTAVVGAYLQQRLGNAKGAKMIDQALAKLRAAGYS